MAEPTSAARRGAEPRLPSAFADLISPITVNEFAEQYWEKKHLILHRRDPDYYAGLLTLADMDHLIATARIRSSDLRVMNDGEGTPISELVSETGNGANAREALYAEYRKGATINLLFLEQHWNPLDLLCQSMTELFGGLVHVNTYLTPAGTRGLTEHYDTHDVFVAQVYGSKRWRLYDQPVRLPTREQRYKRPAEGPGEPMADFTLEAGDLLYMPRGTVHQAVSNDRASLHLTIGVTATTWVDVLEQAVGKAAESKAVFREALPLRFAVDDRQRQVAEERAGALFQELLETIRPEAVVEAARVKAVLARKPALDGHLLDLEAVRELTLDTKLSRRGQVVWSLRPDSQGQVALEFNGKVVRFPDHVADELRYAATTDTFTAHEIPGTLDESGRLVLVRRLLQEGFLTAQRPLGAVE